MLPSGPSRTCDDLRCLSSQHTLTKAMLLAKVQSLHDKEVFIFRTLPEFRHAARNAIFNASKVSERPCRQKDSAARGTPRRIAVAIPVCLYALDVSGLSEILAVLRWLSLASLHPPWDFLHVSDGTTLHHRPIINKPA